MLAHADLREQHHRLTQQFGSLFLSHRHKVWWYEFVEMLRKAMMTGMLAALPEGIFRNAVSVVVCVFFLSVCASSHPFKLKSDYFLQLSLLFMLFAKFYANLLISGDAFKQKHEMDALGDVLIQGTVAVLLYGAITLFCMAPAVRKAIDDAIAVLDEDGDGDVSIFEMMTASKEKRREAMQDLMSGAAKAAGNFEELATSGHIIHSSDDEEGSGVDNGGVNNEDEETKKTEEKKSKKKKKDKKKKDKKSKKDVVPVSGEKEGEAEAAAAAAAEPVPEPEP